MLLMKWRDSEQILATNTTTPLSNSCRACHVLHLNIRNMQGRMADIKDDDILKSTNVISIMKHTYQKVAHLHQI